MIQSFRPTTHILKFPADFSCGPTTHLLVGAERPAGLPARRGRSVGLGPRQFQQRDRLRRVRSGPASVRPVPPHGHVGQADPKRRRHGVQRRDVPCRDDGGGAQTERDRDRDSGQLHDDDVLHARPKHHYCCAGDARDDDTRSMCCCCCCFWNATGFVFVRVKQYRRKKC